MKNTTNKNSASSVSTLGEKTIKKSQIKINKLKKKEKLEGENTQIQKDLIAIAVCGL